MFNPSKLDAESGVINGSYVGEALRAYETQILIYVGRLLTANLLRDELLRCAPGDSHRRRANCVS
jgi:hypothetical protein